MPTYDYQCGACGHSFEKFQPITSRPVRKCPSCGKPKAKRLPGAGSVVIFKGGGFYCTDYRSDSYRKAAQAEKDKPAASAPKTDKSGSDKKPAEKT